MSLDELQSKYNLDKKHYFKYLQLRSFVNAKQGGLDKIPYTQLEKIFLKNVLRKGIISEFYNNVSNASENTKKKLLGMKTYLPLLKN